MQKLILAFLIVSCAIVSVLIYRDKRMAGTNSVVPTSHFGTQKTNSGAATENDALNEVLLREKQLLLKRLQDRTKALDQKSPSMPIRQKAAPYYQAEIEKPEFLVLVQKGAAYSFLQQFGKIDWQAPQKKGVPVTNEATRNAILAAPLGGRIPVEDSILPVLQHQEHEWNAKYRELEAKLMAR